MRLRARDEKLELAGSVEVANSFTQRLRGLLGREHMIAGTALWIKRCNSIHTFFMNFAIDVVFVDRNLMVRAVRRNLPPWRMTFPVYRADSVFELPAGSVPEILKVGDKLYVGD